MQATCGDCSTSMQHLSHFLPQANSDPLPEKVAHQYEMKKTCMCCSFIAPGLQVHVSISVLSLDTKKKDFQRDCQGCRPEPKRSEDESFFVSKHCAV